MFDFDQKPGQSSTTKNIIVYLLACWPTFAVGLWSSIGICCSNGQHAAGGAPTLSAGVITRSRLSVLGVARNCKRSNGTRDEREWRTANAERKTSKSVYDSECLTTSQRALSTLQRVASTNPSEVHRIATVLFAQNRLSISSFG